MKVTYTAYTASDLYQAGFSCDGRPFIAESFYVLIENEAGRRFRHDAIFNGTVPFECEESGDTVFPDFREEASAKADRLANRVNAALASGKSLDFSHWSEVDPAYGSDEYQSQGIELQRFFSDKNS